MKHQSFDDIVRQKAGNHEALVPEDAWANISQKKKKRRLAIWWWLPILGVLVAAIVIQMGNSQESREEVIVTVPAATATTNDAVKQQRRDQSGSTSANYPAIEAAAPGEQNKVKPIERQQPTGNISHSNNPIRNQHYYKSGTGLRQSLEQTAGKNGRTYATVKGVAVSKRNQSRQSLIRQEAGKGGPLNKYASIDDVGKEERQVTKRLPTTESATVNVSPAHSKTLLPHHYQYEQKALLNSDRTALLEGLSRLPSTKAIPIKLLRKSRVSVEIAIQPVIGFKTGQNKGNYLRHSATGNTVTSFQASDVESRSSTGLGFSAAVSKNIARRWRASVGFQYLQLKERVTMSGRETVTEFSVVQRLINGGTGPVLEADTVFQQFTGTRTIKAVNSNQALSVPVIFHYTVKKGKLFNLEVAGGLNINILGRYRNSIEGSFESGTHVYKKGTAISGLGAGLQTGLRFSYRYNKKMELFAEPLLRISIVDDQVSTFRQGKLHQAGMLIGIRLK